jgi:hypothetical protein
MLTIDPPFYQVKGVTVFRDHEDLDQFYCLPPTPKLTVVQPTGQLAFSLFKYRRDLTDNPALSGGSVRGAGFATFETELPIEKMDFIRSQVASLSQRPDARISPVMFRSGIVHAIVAHAAGDGMIEDMVETSKAPLTAPYHAAFALALSAEASTLFQQAALGGQLPVGVVYEMRFLALTPSLNARVTMDYERIYDHFSASIGFSYYVSVKLDLDLAWLIQHEFVKIEITAFTDGADNDRQQRLVMELVKARIQLDFFRSGIPPQQDEGLSGPLAGLLGNVLGKQVTSATALFVLKAKLEVVRETKTFELLFAGRTAVELTHVAAGLLSNMTAGGLPPVIREIDLDDPFFSLLKVQIIAAIDFNEMEDLREAVVHMSRGDRRTSYVFDKQNAEPYQFEAPLVRPADDEYTFEVECHFDPDRGSGPTNIHAGPFRSRRRALVIDPLEYFQYRRVRVLMGVADSGLVARFVITFRVPGEIGQPDQTRAVVMVDKTNPEIVWRLRLPADAPSPRIFASTEWEDRKGQRHPLQNNFELIQSTIVVNEPFDDILTIVITPAADWNVTLQVQATIEYRDEDYTNGGTLQFDNANKASQTLRIPVRSKSTRKFRWQQVIIAKDKPATQSDWVETDSSLLLLGSEPVKQGEVRVVWIGAPGDVLGLRIDFRVPAGAGEDQQRSIFLRAGQNEANVVLPLQSDGRLQYHYEVTAFTAEGERVTRSSDGDTSLLVVR